MPRRGPAVELKPSQVVVDPGMLQQLLARERPDRGDGGGTGLHRRASSDASGAAGLDTMKETRGSGVLPSRRCTWPPVSPDGARGPRRSTRASRRASEDNGRLRRVRREANVPRPHPASPIRSKGAAPRWHQGATASSTCRTSRRERRGRGPWPSGNSIALHEACHLPMCAGSPAKAASGKPPGEDCRCDTKRNRLRARDPARALGAPDEFFAAIPCRSGSCVRVPGHPRGIDEDARWQHWQRPTARTSPG
jgi:hypothetical protein